MDFLGFGKVPGYRLQKIFERVLGGQVFRLQGVTKNHSWLQGYIAIFEHIVDFEYFIFSFPLSYNFIPVLYSISLTISKIPLLKSQTACLLPLILGMLEQIVDF